jgi:hypothetical protein
MKQPKARESVTKRPTTMKLGSLIRDKASGLIKSSMKEELGEIHRSKMEDHMSEHKTVGMDLTMSPRSSSGE